MMTVAETKSRTELIAAVDDLARFAAELSFDSLPESVRDRLHLMLVDLLGVTVAGARTQDMSALFSAWNSPAGDAPILGTTLTTTPETAAFLSAVSACMLELDEGNKHAKGHPAVHVVYCAMAALQESERTVSGKEFLTAVAAGYEIAARFGRALTRHPQWHTHGHWGAAGAACAAALINRGTPDEIAAAIDSSAGLMTVAPWLIVLEGDFTRNLWAASANTAGLHAARLAKSGLVGNTGALNSTLGTLIGSLEPRLLVEGLGDQWLMTQGYGKLHSSCSYTHAAVDLVQSLKQQHPLAAADIAVVRVATHSLAEPLFGRGAHNRLSAMFSFPFVVAAAILNDRLDAAAMDPNSATFAEVLALSDRVQMEVRADFDALLPTERWARVDIEFTDGTSVGAAQPNPRGDVDYFPLGTDDIEKKLTSLIGRESADIVEVVVRELFQSDDAEQTLAALSRTMT